MLWSSNKVFRNYLKLLISNLILECVSKTIVNWNVSLLQHYTKSFDKFNLNGNKAKEWIISLIVLKTLSSVNSLIFIIWTSLVTSVIILKIDFSRLNRDFNDLGNRKVQYLSSRLRESRLDLPQGCVRGLLLYSCIRTEGGCILITGSACYINMKK